MNIEYVIMRFLLTLVNTILLLNNITIIFNVCNIFQIMSNQNTWFYKFTFLQTYMYSTCITKCIPNSVKTVSYTAQTSYKKN